MSFLSEPQRKQVFDAVIKTIERKFVNPSKPGPDTDSLRTQFEREITSAVDGQSFEVAMNRMLQSLGASHTGFFHESKPRAGGKIALAATFMKAETPDGPRWVFQDVHPGGSADNANIVPGDVLLTIDGAETTTAEPLAFQLGQDYTLGIRRADGVAANLQVTLPGSQEKKRPLIVPDKVVLARKLANDIGLIRVSMFPGVLGMDVSRDMSRAVAELDTDRLIFDLRGNSGGGIGCLRLMSLLCADVRGVGYSLGKKQIVNGTRKESLARFSRIPSCKLQVLPLALRFATAGRAVAIFTEGLGHRRHHGRSLLLVNEHSASATEMVAAFASEERVAHLVGVKTPGRLVGASSFKVGYGYRVALPVAAYFTWAGQNLEGVGVAPDTECGISFEDLRAGRDPQLERAQEIARKL
jgi:C-terminal processing protease CtpA/Prc